MGNSIEIGCLTIGRLPSHGMRSDGIDFHPEEAGQFNE